MNTDDVLDKIDRTLTFYSAGLGEELTVKVEREYHVDRAAIDAWIQAVLTANHPLDDWQQRVLGAMRQAMDAVGRAFAEAAPALEEFNRAARGFHADFVILDETHAWSVARQARLRRMHHLYRMRRS